jgi:hypothetical protein
MQPGVLERMWRWKNLYRYATEFLVNAGSEVSDVKYPIVEAPSSKKSTW